MSEPNAPLMHGLTSQPPPTQIPTPQPSSSPHQHHRRRSLLFPFVIVCFVISLGGNVFLVTMVISNWRPWNSHNNPTLDKSTSSSQFGGTEGNVCFTCDYLGPEIESKDTVHDVIRLSSGNTLCCIRENDDVTRLFQKIISDKYTHTHQGMENALSRFETFRSANQLGAHLYLTPQGASPPVWTTEDIYNTAFCSGVACREGNITIREAGRYRVYSCITVKHGLMGNTLVHSISRYNHNLQMLGEKPVLFSKISPAMSERKSSCMEAILDLRNEDRLRVTVSANYYGLLDDSRFSNFFGVQKF